MDAPLLRPAATILLVRDAPQLEVLMVRRHHQIDFAAGALVFPGGKVEVADGDEGWLDHLFGAAGLLPAERAFRVCAIREAFEESGILLARREDDAAWSVGPRAAAGRSAVADGTAEFRALVAGLGLKLDLGALVPFAHWITPAAMSKRFDTRFYLVTAPPDQLAACDGYETVDAEWVRPAEALRLREAGERTIVFPTRLNLALLGQSTSVAEALGAAAARPVAPVEPATERRSDALWVSIGPDLGYGPVPPQPL